MEQPKSYIVFQCHGDKGIFRECVFALLTLSRWSSPEMLENIEIWIYTDDPEWFKSFYDCPLPLHFKKIDASLVKRWKGSIDFIHRVKIEVLKDFTIERTGNILYLDTDIVFLQSIQKMLSEIEEGRLYMCVKEGKVFDEDGDNPIFQKLASFIKRNGPLEIDGDTLNIPQHVSMWNAGVIGFNTTHKHILWKALTFTDTIYPRFPKHIVEQFAFSLYLQQLDTIKGASPFVLHYWNMKEIRILLGKFFHHFTGKSWKELVRYSDLIQVQLMMQEKISFLCNATVMDKIKKKRWKPELPDLDVSSQHL